MTTCPQCDDIRLVCISEFPHENRWHVACKCGNAWNWGSFCRTKKEAKDNWEMLMAEFEKYQRREPK